MSNCDRLVEHVNARFRSFDPRLYQIASLGTLLVYGLLWLHFDVSIFQIALTFGTARLIQYAGTRLYKLPAFDPLSAVVSAVGLCIFLRTNDPAVARWPQASRLRASSRSVGTINISSIPPIWRCSP